MTDEHDATQEDDAAAGAGWACVRLLAMTRVAEERAAQLQQLLRDFDPAVLHGEGASALEAGEMGQVLAALDALQDTIDVMAFVSSTLRGRDDAVVVGAGDVQAHAGRALAQGSIDASFVILAVGMLDTAAGFPALADALASEPAAVASWGDLTARDLLTSFHDGDARLARRVCHAALVHPETPMASLDEVTVQRLADELRSVDG